MVESSVVKQYRFPKTLDLHIKVLLKCNKSVCHSMVVQLYVIIYTHLYTYNRSYILIKIILLIIKNNNKVVERNNIFLYHVQI